jgi:hypothetical protein
MLRRRSFAILKRQRTIPRATFFAFLAIQLPNEYASSQMDEFENYACIKRDKKTMWPGEGAALPLNPALF